VHHTAIGDGHSAGYEVILMISFVICHDKQDGGGGKMAHECQKEKGGVRPRLHLSQKGNNSLDRLQT
jgi:hypothetical protein